MCTYVRVVHALSAYVAVPLRCLISSACFADSAPYLSGCRVGISYFVGVSLCAYRQAEGGVVEFDALGEAAVRVLRGDLASQWACRIDHCTYIVAWKEGGV